jgi:diaminopimelate decarboxylase/aspartate kinase
MPYTHARFAGQPSLLPAYQGGSILSQSRAPWVVLKFGGTSVSSRSRWDTIARCARDRLAQGLRPVIVCSALAGVSNLLEQLLAAAPSGAWEPVLDEVRRKHVALAADMGLEAASLLGPHFDEIQRAALGASLVREVTPRLHARVMAQGELMSTRLGAAFLESAGLHVAWVDARECLTSDDPADAPDTRRLLSATCSHQADPALQERFAALAPRVILTQGFIARDREGATVLLGRGGSDTSASYFAARLGAVRCEIWTDVPGMFTANPRQVPGARLLRALDYDEAQEIVSTGAKVLHPRCIAPARAAGIPLHVLDTDRPWLEGTVVSARAQGGSAQLKAISVKSGITLVSMDTPGMWQQVGFLADIFGCFRRAGLSVDLVSTSEMNVTVTLDATANRLDQDTLERLTADLSRFCVARVIGPCSSISLVGRNVRAILHKLGPAFEVFEEQKIHLVSQAASDLNLSFVVDSGQAERLVAKLHALLFSHRKNDPVLGPTWQEIHDGVRADDAAPTPWWVRRRSELLRVAEQRSPVYVYDAATLDWSVAELKSIDAISRVLYSIKANPNADILRRFRGWGLGFECVSPGEVDHVLDLFGDMDPADVLFTPNFAPREEYEHGFARGVRVTLDNLYPLEAWPEVFRGREVFVRIDPGRGRGHHEYVQTAGAASKFGISLDQIERLCELASRLDVRVLGLHAHRGSGIRTAEDWAETALTLASIAARFPGVRVLDLGGGLAVPERTGQAGVELDVLRDSLRQVKQAYPRFDLWLEPGRYLVACAGALLCRVTQTKQKGDVHYVGVDAGMNSLIRPALYGAWHDIVNLSRLDDAPAIVANVVGPICETGDLLGHARHLPETRDGDVMLIATAGAYGRSMSSRYNLREPAGELVLGE